MNLPLSKSAPDQSRLVKRTTIVARMFYHTGICLLCETNPMAATNPQVMQEMHEWQMRNARELCGIVAHVKDRSVCPFASLQTQKRTLLINIQRRRKRSSSFPPHSSRMSHPPRGTGRSPRRLRPHPQRNRLAHRLHLRRLAEEMGPSPTRTASSGILGPTARSASTEDARWYHQSYVRKSGFRKDRSSVRGLLRPAD